MPLAYATTIHKSQGSEYPVVVIPMVTQPYAMPARNLLYTSVTLSKRLVVLVGQSRTLTIAVKNGGFGRRSLLLRQGLQDAMQVRRRLRCTGACQGVCQAVRRPYRYRSMPPIARRDLLSFSKALCASAAEVRSRRPRGLVPPCRPATCQPIQLIATAGPSF